MEIGRGQRYQYGHYNGYYMAMDVALFGVLYGHGHVLFLQTLVFDPTVYTLSF